MPHHAAERRSDGSRAFLMTCPDRPNMPCVAERRLNTAKERNFKPAYALAFETTNAQFQLRGNSVAARHGISTLRGKFAAMPRKSVRGQCAATPPWSGGLMVDGLFKARTQSAE
jgi:hypothetical protein